MDDDYLPSTFSNLYHVLMHDVRTTQMPVELRRKVTDAVLRLSAHVKVSLDPEQETELLHSLLLPERYIKTDDVGGAVALALLNPELLSVPAMHARYFASLGFGDHWVTNIRNRSRSRAVKYKYAAPDNIKLTRRPSPEPMDDQCGTFYSEERGGDEDHPGPPAVPGHRLLSHHSSELYLFHAWAWGRRRYAQWLHVSGASTCMYSGLTIAALTKDNPRDGSGPAFLQLARQYLRDREASNYLRLPVPFHKCNAHELKGSPLYHPRYGAPVGRIHELLAAEFALRGLKYS